MTGRSIEEFKSIAVIQTAFLGDTALILYLFDYLKKHYPEKKLTLALVTTPAAASYCRFAASVDKTIAYDKRDAHKGLEGLKTIANELKKNKVDLILAPHRSLRTTLLTEFAKPDFSVGFDKNAASFLYGKRVRHKFHLHEIERNFELLSPFGINKSSEELPEIKFNFRQEDIERVECLIEENGIVGKTAAVAPGSVWKTKRWLPESFAKLAVMLKKAGITPVFIGSVAEREFCTGLAEKSNGISIAGDTSIIQTIYFLKGCSVLISNDSAPVHFAGLVKCPVAAIFGATSPIFGFAPRGNNDKVIEIKNLNCRPCRLHGSKKCPIGTFECMERIRPEMVFEAVMEII